METEEKIELKTNVENIPIPTKRKLRPEEEAAQDEAHSQIYKWRCGHLGKYALTEAARMYRKVTQEKCAFRDDPVTQPPIPPEHVAAVLQLAGSLIIAAEMTRLTEIVKDESNARSVLHRLARVRDTGPDE
jgi:hypothetical protein